VQTNHVGCGGNDAIGGSRQPVANGKPGASLCSTDRNHIDQSSAISPPRVAAMATISIQTPEIGDTAVATRLLAIQHAAYQIEADLIGYDGIPPLDETVDELQSQPVEWLAAFEGDAIVGAIGFVVEPDGSCDIDRLIVDPDHARRGIGRALVDAVLDHPIVTVSTGARNEPACALYESLGFQRTDEREIAPGINVVQFARPGPLQDEEVGRGS
jgi:ribosomal protein S18 acetylase RimI-like enzyme